MSAMRIRFCVRSCFSLLFALAALALAGCQSLPRPAGKPPAEPSVSQSITGVASQTFPAPLSRVKSASVNALSQMKMRIDALARNGQNEVIRAASGARTIEIELEPLGPGETRMRVAARSGGLLYDSALGAEVIRRTESQLRS